MSIGKQGVEEVAGVPSGLISMWHGLISNIPSGYIICDGNNSTPNLLTKFVQGVTTAGTNPGDTGGEATHTLTETELAGHIHAQRNFTSAGGAGSLAQLGKGTEVADKYTTSTGGDSAHENEPTFYDVAFLMKS